MNNLTKFLGFFVFIFVVFSLPLVFAYYHTYTLSKPGTNSDSNSLTSATNSGSNSDDKESKTNDKSLTSKSENLDDSSENEKENSTDNKTKKEFIERFKEGEVRREFKKEITTPNGRKIEIDRKVEFDEEGKFIIKIERKITDEEGNEREIKIEIREKNGTREIKVEGEKKNITVETELELGTEFEGNDTDLNVNLSNGRKAEIKIMPDRASEIAIERLKTLNFSVQLKEVKHKNVPKVVYLLETNKTGRFLGIIKLKMKVEGQIDAETGEFLGESRPWWAFLVFGKDQLQQTTQTTTQETEKTQQETINETPQIPIKESTNESLTNTTNSSV